MTNHVRQSHAVDTIRLVVHKVALLAWAVHSKILDMSSLTVGVAPVSQRCTPSLRRLVLEPFSEHTQRYYAVSFSAKCRPVQNVLR
jgi:hypothetical protein